MNKMTKDLFEYYIDVNIKLDDNTIKTNCHLVKSFRSQNDDDDFKIKSLYKLLNSNFDMENKILYFRNVCMNINGIIRNGYSGMFEIQALGIENEFNTEHILNSNVDFYSEFKFDNFYNKNISLINSHHRIFLLTQKNSFTLFDDVYFPSLYNHNKLWIKGVQTYNAKVFFICSEDRQKLLTYISQQSFYEQLLNHTLYDIEYIVDREKYRTSPLKIINNKQGLKFTHDCIIHKNDINNGIIVENESTIF